MASLGSTMFSITWKARHTPSGRLIPAQRARAVHTSASGSIGQLGWVSPTACSPNSLRGLGQDPQKRAEGGHAINIQDQVTLASWPTCQASDVTGGGQAKRADGRSNLNDFAMLAGWPTTAVSADVALAGWATATANSANGTVERFVARKHRAIERGSQMGDSVTDLAMQARLTAHGPEPIGYLLGPSGWEIVPASGPLNAEFSLWLMGVPDEFSRCVLRATQLYSRRRKRGSKR